MLKKVYLLFLCLLAFSCKGGPSPIEKIFNSFKTTISGEPFFSSMPASGGLVFIGAAGKRISSEETMQLALEDAARQIALFYRVSGEYAVEHNVGAGLFDYISNTYTDLQYDEGGASRYVEALEFDEDTDTFEYENALFVRTVYPMSLPSPVTYRPSYKGSDKKPDWVSDPPLEVNGYSVGVGFSNRRSSMADTYNNSRNNAIFALIRNINATIQSRRITYNDETFFGYYVSNDNTTYSYGTVTGFYVLDTWIDPNSKTVWTLAIASGLK